MSQRKTTKARATTNPPGSQPEQEVQVKGYTPGKGEEKDVHVQIERPDFDQLTGERRSKPYRQIFNPQAWKQFQEYGPRLGYWVQKVLHAPAGVDTTYANPDPRKAKAAKVEALEAKLKAVLKEIEAAKK